MCGYWRFAVVLISCTNRSAPKTAAVLRFQVRVSRSYLIQMSQLEPLDHHILALFSMPVGNRCARSQHILQDRQQDLGQLGPISRIVIHPVPVHQASDSVVRIATGLRELVG